jgi:hypothetical protein
MCLRIIGRTWICRTQLCHLPSGGEQRVEIVVQGIAEVEFFGCFEQSDLVERFAERGQDGLPRIPLAQDVVARLGSTVDGKAIKIASMIDEHTRVSLPQA